LPANFGQIAATSTLDLEEGGSYEAPTKTYPNGAIDYLRHGIWVYQEGGSEDLMQQATVDLEERFRSLSEAIPRMLDATMGHRQEDPQDETTPRILYLIQRGSQIFEEALSELQRFMEGEDLDPGPVLASLQMGSDYLMDSAELARSMVAASPPP
jgi:hypothetical protein